MGGIVGGGWSWLIGICGRSPACCCGTAVWGADDESAGRCAVAPPGAADADAAAVSVGSSALTADSPSGLLSVVSGLTSDIRALKSGPRRQCSCALCLLVVEGVGRKPEDPLLEAGS